MYKIPRPKILIKKRLWGGRNFCSMGYLAHHLLKLPIEEIHNKNYLFIKVSLSKLLSLPVSIINLLVFHNDRARSNKERLEVFENFCLDNNILTK